MCANTDCLSASRFYIGINAIDECLYLDILTFFGNNLADAQYRQISGKYPPFLTEYQGL